MTKNKLKKLAAVLLAGAMWISTIPVIPTTANSTTKHVVAQNGYTAATGEIVYDDIPAAINALGVEGGTIYIKGAVTTVAGLEDGTTTSHKPVTISGYTGASTDSLTITTGSNAIYGDITFENLTVTGKNIATHNHTVTYGDGAVVGSGTTLGYAAYTSGTEDKFVINAGSFGDQHLLQKWSGTYNKSYDWTLNGGTISSLVLGNYVGTGGANTINGDIKFTQNGGTVTTLYLGSRMQNNVQQTVKGDFVYTMNGGSVTNMYYGGYKKYNGKVNDAYNNVALIFNNASMTNAVTIKKIDASVKPTATVDMIVLNNYESNKVSVADNVAYFMDYIIHVNGGKAEPVFERTTDADPSTSTLKGFFITADEGNNWIPYVGDTKVVKNVDGYYDLSNFKEDTDGKIVEINFKEVATKVVVTQENYSAPAGEEVYSDIPAAINALGTEGGIIYVKGAVTTTAGLEDGTTTSHELVTITGYTDASTDSLTIATGSNAIYGDITFENLTVTGKNIATHNHIVTYGNGTVVGSGTTLGYEAYTSGTEDKFVINTGSFGDQHLLQKWSGTYNKSYDWTLNGGTISSLVLGNYVGTGGENTINGDIKFTQNGGTVTTLYLGSRMQNNVQQTVKGDFVYTMNGGSVTNMYYGGYKKYNGKVNDSYNNVALIFNNASMTNNVTVGQVNQSVKPTTNTDIIILNNYESNKVTVNNNVSSQIDYILRVVEGKAEPVFERTNANDPSTSALVGFRLIADEGTEYAPYIGGDKLIADTDGYYNLSNYASSGQAIEITFGESIDASTYVNFRNDFSNSYEKLSKGETVNVVYFGGSMTHGYGSSNQEKRSWRGLTKAWLNAKFPTATINHINRALGESGTYLGTFRTPHDITNVNPDVLFIEYSINDKYFGATYAQAASQFETIIREVKAVNPDCDIVTVLVTDEKVVLNTRDGILHTQAQAHEDISAAYGIPSVNVGKALADRFAGITSATLGAEWNKYSMNDNDIVHLNDTGYAIYFSAVKAFLETVYSGNDNESYDVAVTFPSDIVSTSLFDGNRTIIDGEKTIIVENSDKAPVTTTMMNLQTLVAASNANGGTGFVFDSDGRFFAASYSYAENYKGTITLPANTSGKFVAEMTGTELAILGTMASGSTFTYSVARKSDGTTVVKDATCSVGGTRPTQVFKDYKSDTYIVTLDFAASDSDIKIGTIMTRDASRKTIHEKYEKLYVRFGGTGDGTSEDKPAPSVAWLINNIVSSHYDAEDSVEIYIMQDDTLALMNSTKTNADAPKVGNGKRVTPDAGFAAWTSDNDGTTATHTATIVIKSYQDGLSKQNYLGYRHELGWNTPLTLQGPTVFDNISLVTCYSSMVNIYADGFGITFNKDFKIYTINASRYWTAEQAKAWDGEFKEITPYYTQIGIGNSTTSNPTGLGGKLVFNKAIKNQWVGTDNSSSRIIFGDETEGATFAEDVALYVNRASELNIRIGSGTAGKKNTFAKNLNLLINSVATVDFNANSIADTEVLGAVQIIRNASATVTGFDALQALNPAGGYWNLKTDNGDKEQYLDVTATAGIFSVTEGLSVIAINSENGTVTVAGNGVLDLSSVPGTYNVYCIDYDASEEAYINFGKAIFVKEDTVIDLAKVEPHITEGYAFLGWKQVDGTLPAMSGGMRTEKLSAGTVLVADYATYSIANDGDFFMTDIEMRATSGEVTYALRFIVELKDSIFELVGGKDKVVEYGSLVLPLDYSGGKDIRYNTPIYNYNNSKLIGTPTTVPAKNIFKQLDGAVQYTAAVMNIDEVKYDRFYSVQGYVRYMDENGVERVLYSQYGQSSLYKEALELAANSSAGDATLSEANMIIDYVENDRIDDYNATYSKRKVTLAQAIDNFNIYKYSNKLCVSEYILDWYNNDSLTEIAQVTDTHFVYKSSEDVFNDYEPTLTTYASSGRQWYESLNVQSKVLDVMEFASFADKTIVTGDVVDYTSPGTLQVAERLLWGTNTAVGIRANATGTSNVLATVGNHEPLEALSGVDYGKSKEDVLDDLKVGWSNDIVYHSEMVYNKDGKNGAMTVLIDNGTGTIDPTLADKLAASVAEAREKNAPVLIFMHIPVSDGSEEKTVPEVIGDTNLKGTAANQKESLDNKALMGGSSYTDANGNALYDVITENADIIRGIFVGHKHGYMYSEVQGTGASRAYTIPQFVLGAAHLDNGYVLKINIK